MSGIVPYPWRFTQLAPPPSGPKKTLVLDGYNAPFGRPRKSPVVEKEGELRQTAVYYDGNDIPTRLIFGDKQNAIQLTGRFMDSRIGTAGAAQAKADEVEAFRKDKIPCSIEWGGIYAAQGLLTKFKVSYESAEELAWTLTIEIDFDATQPINAPAAPATSVSSLMAFVEGKLLAAFTNVGNIPADIEFQPSFFDDIANAISAVNSALSTPKQFADSVDNYESTLNADAERFLAGVKQLQQAVAQLQITLGRGDVDVAVASANAHSQAQWYQSRSDNELELLEVLAVLATQELTTERVLRGSPQNTIQAQGGDTWESLARRYMGSSGKGDALRQANGVRYGTQPAPGQLLHVPQS